MTTRSSDLDSTISELLSLIELSPTDVRLRVQLLEVLHANNRVDEFVMEALEYKDNCDLTDDAIWGRICVMGSEIDPGNRIFDKVPTTNMQSTQNGFLTDSQSSTGSHSSSEPKHVLAKSQSNPQVKPKDIEYEGTEHRNPVERRVEDRRMIEMLWTERERRVTTRRSRKRRPSDE